MKISSQYTFEIIRSFGVWNYLKIKSQYTFDIITFLRTYLTSLQLVIGTVAAVECLPALHYSADFIFLSFRIMGSIWEL